MPILIAENIKQKLTDKHKVTEKEIEQCFLNRDGRLLKDNRENHQTLPPTLWFLALTNSGRNLKIVFIQIDEDVHIKTAYEANDEEIRIYKKFAM